MGITEEMVAEYEVAKATLEAAKERFVKVENALCQEMLVSKTKTDLIVVRGQKKQVTVVAGETLTIDSAGLKEYLGAVKFRKVCKPPKADGKLLEKAIKDGLIPAEDAAQYVKITSNKPYIRVSSPEAGE